MRKYSELVVCLYMTDNSRIITTFPINPKIPHCAFEDLMIDILNNKGQFVKVKSYRSEIELEFQKEIVINTTNIVQIESINAI